MSQSAQPVSTESSSTQPNNIIQTVSKTAKVTGAKRKIKDYLVSINITPGPNNEVQIDDKPLPNSNFDNMILELNDARRKKSTASDAVMRVLKREYDQIPKGTFTAGIFQAIRGMKTISNGADAEVNSSTSQTINWESFD